MTDKLSCNIVQDLLPMYVDGLLTPESQSEVKKHLEECETCRELCARLSAFPTFLAEWPCPLF